MAVRRFLAKRKLARCRELWPIKPGTEKPPIGWPGWPDGKKFAVVLTHDVEGPTGLERVNSVFPFWVGGEGNHEIHEREGEGRNAQHSTWNSSSRQNQVQADQPSTFDIARSGYVELPYTLPQDSTIFALFREQGIDIWKRKLDWIAEHGGMAMLDVHPDYMTFNGSIRKGAEYRCALYEEFLQHITRKFERQYLHAAPNQVAAWDRASFPS